MRMWTRMTGLAALLVLAACGTTTTTGATTDDVAQTEDVGSGVDATAADTDVADAQTADVPTADDATADVSTTDATDATDMQTNDAAVADVPTQDVQATDAPTYQQVQEQALSGCGGFGPMSCHGKAPFGGSLNLSASNNWKALVNVDSTSKPGVALVKPGDPENSMLWRKLTNTLAQDGSEGDPMPKGEAIQWQKPPYADLVYAWILAGAKDN